MILNIEISMKQFFSDKFVLYNMFKFPSVRRLAAFGYNIKRIVHDCAKIPDSFLVLKVISHV